uniref:Outer membrane autotransporter barrel domain n=1 Tax=Rhodopseudomonas palustris (strain BisA53) TaxID=316055 RepID=Q07P01_RHOP5
MLVTHARRNGAPQRSTGWLASLTAIAVAILAYPELSLAQGVQWGPSLIGAPTAWALGLTGSGVTVAFGDTGIDVNHPAFAGKIDPRSRNFVPNYPGGPIDPAEINHIEYDSVHHLYAVHGTHVTGDALASSTSLAPGIAYDAHVVVMRDLSFTIDAVDQAIDYFTGLAGVRILNLSYGGVTPSATGLLAWPAEAFNPLQAAAILRATAAGKIVVAAIGNDRTTDPVAARNARGIGLFPFMQPANAHAGVYDDGGHNFDFSALLRQPGLLIAATAVAPDKTLPIYADMCGVAASWCVAAPGGTIPTDPNGIYSTFPTYDVDHPSGYGYNIGTSEAAAFVTGALAVLQQAFPSYNSQDLAHVLFATAENIDGQAAVNATYGYGLIRLDRAIDGPTTLAAGAAVNLGSLHGLPTMTYWSQPLTTGGAFSKTGDGSLIIAGRTNASGDVTVSGGALGVDGTLTLDAGRRLIVQQGGTLAGFGWIVGDTVVNGTLSAGQLPNYQDLIANNGGTLPAGIPTSGTSAGTLTFIGDLALGSAATMRVNVDGDLTIPGGPRTFDKYLVDGAFTANGTLAPILRGIAGGTNSYTPALGSQFHFVTASGGVSGSFSGLSQPQGLASGTRFDALYGSNGITLAVTPVAYADLGSAGFAQTASQIAVGQVLDAIRPQAAARMSAEQAVVFPALYRLSGDTIALTLEQLSPTIYGDALMGWRNAWSQTDAAISEQLETRRGFRSGSRAQVATDPAGRTAWLTGFERSDTVGGGTGGYSDRLGGLAGGFDAPVSDDLTLGAAFGFIDSRTSATTGASVSGDSVQLQLYGGYRLGASFLEAQAGAGRFQGTATRPLPLYGMRPSAETAGTAFGGSLRAGLRFTAADWQIEPSIMLAGVALRQDGLTETGGGLLGLTLDAMSLDSLRSVSAVRTERRIVLANGWTVIPSVQVGWQHEYGDTSVDSRGALALAPSLPFIAGSAPIGRDAAVFGLRTALQTAGRIEAHVGYAATLQTDSYSHTATAGLRALW